MTRRGFIGGLTSLFAAATTLGIHVAKTRVEPRMQAAFNGTRWTVEYVKSSFLGAA